MSISDELILLFTPLITHPSSHKIVLMCSTLHMCRLPYTLPSMSITKSFIRESVTNHISTTSIGTVSLIFTAFEELIGHIVLQSRDFCQSSR